MVFVEPKSWWNYDIDWLLKISCSELFGDWKYGLFLSQNVDRKMIFTGYWEVLVLNFSVMGNKAFLFGQKVDERIIFTWSFWAFHDIPRLGKYGFSCSTIYGVNISPPPPSEIILNLEQLIYESKIEKQYLCIRH